MKKFEWDDSCIGIVPFQNFNADAPLPFGRGAFFKEGFVAG